MYNLNEIKEILNCLANYPHSRGRNIWEEAYLMKYLINYYEKTDDKAKLEALEGIFNLYVTDVRKDYDFIGFRSEMRFNGYEIKIRMPIEVRNCLKKLYAKIEYQNDKNKSKCDEYLEELSK